MLHLKRHVVNLTDETLLVSNAKFQPVIIRPTQGEPLSFRRGIVYVVPFELLESYKAKHPKIKFAYAEPYHHDDFVCGPFIYGDYYLPAPPCYQECEKRGYHCYKLYIKQPYARYNGPIQVFPRNLPDK